MFICRALCQDEKGKTVEIAVCTESREESDLTQMQLDHEVFLKYDRPIADAILRAAASNLIPNSFMCNGEKYTMLKYSINRYEKYYNKYRTSYAIRREVFRPASEIFVYTQRCRCVRCFAEYRFDSIISICGIIPLSMDRSKKVPVDLQQCTRCQRFFIDAQSLSRYEQQYGKLSLVRHKITGNEPISRSQSDSEWDYNPDSILSRNGYNTKISNRERKQLLINMIEGGISKVEIKDKLSEFIFYRSKRNPYASEIWKEDLDFVNSYQLGSEPIVYFR